MSDDISKEDEMEKNIIKITDMNNIDDNHDIDQGPVNDDVEEGKNMEKKSSISIVSEVSNNDNDSTNISTAANLKNSQIQPVQQKEEEKSKGNHDVDDVGGMYISSSSNKNIDTTIYGDDNKSIDNFNEKSHTGAGDIEEGNQRHYISEDEYAAGSERTDSLMCIEWVKCYPFISCLVKKRIGNMFVISWKKDRHGLNKEGPRKINVVLGPYWPFATFITLPIIVIPATFVGIYCCPKFSPMIWGPWLCLVIITIISLIVTSTSDPGLIPRYYQQPPEEEKKRICEYHNPRRNSCISHCLSKYVCECSGSACLDLPLGPPFDVSNQWLFNDQSDSWRPPRCKWADDGRVLVVNFDHTCPWTGTCIGNGNLLWFTFFVMSSQLLLYSTIILAFASVLVENYSD